MSFNRYFYDEVRVKKKLQESTGPGRYMLNMPGNGAKPSFTEDPYIRPQKWGANLRSVVNGSAIDIDNDLTRRPNNLTKYWTDYDNKNISRPITYKNKYPTNKHFITNQSRATHPAWEYRGLEQNHLYPLLRNPQENTCMHFQNNLNTRLLERDNFKPIIQQFDINNN